MGPRPDPHEPEMIDREHHRKLERMYASAPVTKWYGAKARIDDGTAEVRDGRGELRVIRIEVECLGP